MSTTFTDHLAATRANLERLEVLHAAHPELFAAASDSICIDPAKATVYMHYNRTPDCDFAALVRKVGGTGWRRENGVCAGRWDWRGMVNGVELVIMGAEARPEPEPLALDLAPEPAVEKAEVCA